MNDLGQAIRDLKERMDRNGRVHPTDIRVLIAWLEDSDKRWNELAQSIEALRAQI